MSNRLTPTQPNPQKIHKNGEFVPRPRKGQGPNYLTMWCWVDALFSNHLFFLQKPQSEPAVSDDTLGPAHRQHPDIEEPGTPAFLLQGTPHRKINGC